MQLEARRLALKVALIYVGVSAVWIFFSDELVKRLVSDPDTRTTASILKGWWLCADDGRRDVFFVASFVEPVEKGSGTAQ